MTGQNTHAINAAGASLRFGIETADCVDFIVKKVEPQRSGPHRKDVHNAASNRKFAGCHCLLDASVACGNEGGLQLTDAYGLTFAKEKRIAGNIRLWRKALRGGASCRNQHIGPGLQIVARKVIKGFQAFAYQVCVRTHGIVGKSFPVGKARNFERGIEPGDFLIEPRDVKRVGADQNRHALLAAGQFNERRESRRAITAVYR